MNKDSAAWAWLILVVLINAYWILYDFAYAKRTKNLTMTAQFQRWLHEPVAGPLIFGATVFVVGAFMYHMLVKAAS